MKLYRVVDQESWQAAQLSGKVPRCNSDKRADHVHLNLLESVEAVAAAYFEPIEIPLVLEIDTDSLGCEIVWHEATEHKPWKQPCAKIDSIPLKSVTRVVTLEHELMEGKNTYKLSTK